MDAIVLVCGILLVLASAGVIYRLAKGPSLLDRVIASDVLLMVVFSAVSVDMVWRRSWENLTFLVVVALVGFLGSVTVARFANNAQEPRDADRNDAIESQKARRPARRRPARRGSRAARQNSTTTTTRDGGRS